MIFPDIFLTNKSYLSNKKIVIKIGTNTIINGKINKRFLHTLVNEVYNLKKNNNEVIIVSSGAIGFGKHKLNFNKKNLTIKEQQGLASIGQTLLMNEFNSQFNSIGLTCAQLLISQMDLKHKNTLNNIKNTLEFLKENNIVSIINENDVVSTKELRKNGHFSDNDFLSALIAKKTKADILVLLTSVNGLIGKNNTILSELNNTDELLILNENSSNGTGGIDSKIKTIKFATKNNIEVFISGQDNFVNFYNGNYNGTIIRKNSKI